MAEPSSIAEDVLVAQFHADLGRHVRQFVDIFDRLLAASGLLGNLSEQTRPRQFFGRSRTCPGRLVNADGVDLDIRLFHEVFDFALGVPAIVITSIGDDE